MKRVTRTLAALATALLLTAACLLPATVRANAEAAGFYEEMPPLLCVKQTKTESTIGGVTLYTTYPKSANAQVDTQIAELVDALAQEQMFGFSESAPQKATVDAGAIITRTGAKWMSFLTIAEASDGSEQLGVSHDARVYDMETGARVTLEDVFPPDSGAWALMEREIRAQLSAAFPGEAIDEDRLDALCAADALRNAPFTLGAARMTLTYRADDVYIGKHTLLHVHLNYSDIRGMMTPAAFEQTDNSRFKLIALTFDDGPAKASTKRLMDVLREHGAQATFFMVGEMLAGNADVLSRQQDSMHSLQYHTYTHRYPGEFTLEEAFDEKARFAAELSAVTGVVPTMLRAPGGLEGFYVSREIGFPLIHWTFSGGDSGGGDMSRVPSRVIGMAKDGAISLMHDLNGGCAEFTQEILDNLLSRGFLCVTVDELMADAGVTLEDHKIYFSTTDIR